MKLSRHRRGWERRQKPHGGRHDVSKHYLSVVLLENRPSASTFGLNPDIHIALRTPRSHLYVIPVLLVEFFSVFLLQGLVILVQFLEELIFLRELFIVLFFDLHGTGYSSRPYKICYCSL